MIGTNSGHGHAWVRPDGMVTRCGGPIICSACASDQALVIQQSMRDDGMPKSKDERYLRRLLGMAVAGELGLYADDGEMSFGGNQKLPSIDFMRESVENIEKFIILKNRQSFMV